MKNTEETLWNYIDGNCTAAEQKIIAALIADDEAFRLKYLELQNLNNELSAMETDEPSMPFTFNVMEAIRTENAQAPLKAAFNKQIIACIAVFFGVSLLVLLVFVFTTVKWPGQSNLRNLTGNFKMPELNYGKAKAAVEGFVFFDVILALYLVESYLRKKTTTKMS